MDDTCIYCDKLITNSDFIKFQREIGLMYRKDTYTTKTVYVERLGVEDGKICGGCQKAIRTKIIKDWNSALKCLHIGATLLIAYIAWIDLFSIKQTL